MQSKHKQTNCKHRRRKSYGLQLSDYTKSSHYLKDYIEFVTEFPCLLGHPVKIFFTVLNRQHFRLYWYYLSVRDVFLKLKRYFTLETRLMILENLQLINISKIDGLNSTVF